MSSSLSSQPIPFSQDGCAGGRAILHVQGNLQAPVRPDLRHRVDAVLARGARSILLDLAQVTGLDAAGLGELVRLYTTAASARTELRIANAGRRVRTLIDTAGLLEVLSGSWPSDASSSATA